MGSNGKTISTLFGGRVPEPSADTVITKLSPETEISHRSLFWDVTWNR
jgi:hypothetical protein